MVHWRKLILITERFEPKIKPEDSALCLMMMMMLGCDAEGPADARRSIFVVKTAYSNFHRK